MKYRQPIPLTDEIIAFLDTGEPIVVDGRSTDALNYLLNMEYEAHVFPLFQRMLRHNSVVLDIGANFGFYTVKAASRVHRSGQLYSFEANPHTFNLLRKTLYSNSWLENPRIKAHNILVGNTNGEGQLSYSVNELAGASIWRPKIEGPENRTATVPMVRLDDFLPTDLIVDIVKIDVEGHEPHVLQGMRNIIERSQNIKIIAECFEPFFDNSCGGMDNFRAIVSDLGLSMWRILGHGELTTIPPDVPLRGANYCLLAKKIDDLIVGQDIVIEPDSLSIAASFAKGARSVLHDNRVSYSSSIFNSPEQQAQSTITYGPYINLEPGNWEMLIVGRLVGEFGFRLHHDFGRTIILDSTRMSLAEPFTFSLTTPVSLFEVLLYKMKTSESAEIDLIMLKRK